MIQNNIKFSFSNFLLIMIILSFAVFPAFMVDEGNNNFFMLVIMGLSPLIIIYYRRFFLSDIYIFFFLLSYLFSPLLNHPETYRFSTVMYSLMFIATFIAYEQLLFTGRFTIDHYAKLIRSLIYAYFFVLLIQQFCVLTGLPIFNISHYSPAEPWKLNSLSIEPSWSSRIIGLLMYVFIVLKEIIQQRKYDLMRNFKNDKWVWIAFIWVIVTSNSSTGFIFLFIVLLKILKFKNLISVILTMLIVTFILNLFHISALDRILNFGFSVLTLDTDIIIDTDTSASVRVIPMLIAFSSVDFTTFDSWFGHGIDSFAKLLFISFRAFSEEMSGGGMLFIWYEYGFISFFFLVLFTLKFSIDKKDLISILMWFLLVFMYGVNSQIVWLCIILLFTNKYFRKQFLQDGKHYA